MEFALKTSLAIDNVSHDLSSGNYLTDRSYAADLASISQLRYLKARLRVKATAACVVTLKADTVEIATITFAAAGAVSEAVNLDLVGGDTPLMLEVAGTGAVDIVAYLDIEHPLVIGA